MMDTGHGCGLQNLFLLPTMETSVEAKLGENFKRHGFRKECWRGLQRDQSQEKETSPLCRLHGVLGNLFQTPGRIQKVDPPPGSLIYAIGAVESESWGSTVWILPEVRDIILYYTIPNHIR